MKLEVCDAGRMGFAEAYRIQADWVSRRISDPTGEPDRLLLVEHNPVYTLGRYATEANLLFAAAERERAGIALVQTDRGGQVTYHGPGQITGYPIIQLSARCRHGVAWYVNGLEEVLIRTLAVFGLCGTRDAINPGVWLGPDKVAAIGVRVRRRVTMHGFALNVVTNIAHYAGIVPCGIKGRGVTSMHVHCPGITMDAVKRVVVESFGGVFGYTDVSAAEKNTQ